MKSNVLKACLVLLVAVTPGRAAEISTNGTGGGPWSDPGTWQGNRAPGAQDDVVIRKFDVVVFDRTDEDKNSCLKLQIDPKGVLAFKTGAGKVICRLGDALDSYGFLKLDGTKSASDLLELRMAGDTAEKRRIKLYKGAGMLLYGRPNLRDGRCNVMLSSIKLADAKDEIVSLVEADGSVSIDWQRACLSDVKLVAKKIDNTGARPNERINVVQNQFVGLARLSCLECDTPVIAKNSFHYQNAKPLDEPAINVSYCPLAEIKGNNIRGGFAAGITITYQSDSVLIGNTIEKCTAGITGGYGIPNTMIKKSVVRDCGIGLRLEGASGVLEDTQVEGATTAFHLQNSTLQLTNFQVKDLAPKGTVVLFETGSLSLLNCNIAPGQIKIALQPPTAKVDPVVSWQYAVVNVKSAPADSQIEARTAAPAALSDADINVRNSPAPLVTGLTPLPRTLNPLIVKSWTIDLKAKLIPGPEYTVNVLGPAAKEGAARPILKTMRFRPQENAFRASLDDATPTLEVPLK